jgi:hypothetical protein
MFYYKCAIPALQQCNTEGSRMEQPHVFERVTLLRDDLIRWPAVLRELKSMVETSKIRIVDIRREDDRLTIVYRKL